jgi:hypothetical protein
LRIKETTEQKKFAAITACGVSMSEVCAEEDFCEATHRSTPLPRTSCQHARHH